MFGFLKRTKKPAEPRKPRTEYKTITILQKAAINDFCRNYCTNKTITCEPCDATRTCPLRAFVD